MIKASKKKEAMERSQYASEISIHSSREVLLRILPRESVLIGG